MIPGATTRRRSVLVFKAEPVPPRVEPETPLDAAPEQDDAVRRLSAPMQPQGRRDAGGDVSPRPYPSPPADAGESDVAALIAKVSM
jgi:hypothetical protein